MDLAVRGAQGGAQGWGSHCPDFTLSWKDMSVRLDQAAGWLPSAPSCCSELREGKLIVDRVSGAVDGGSFLAVVGASGSGKTTLLSAITKRLRGRAVSGDVLLNGRAASAQLMSQVCSVVPQHDVATETLTAAEHLHFMAAMRLDARVTSSARTRRVRVLLADLGLSTCADTRMANMSGGERRRLTLAAQLLMPPIVLALDEPCSGLDAEASRMVLEALSLEAARGRAVLCTVHQAAPHLLRLFTHILVLAAGRVAYHGPLQDAEPFLAKVGFRAPAGWPPALHLNGMIQKLCDPAGQHETMRVCTAFASTAQARYLRTYPASEEVLSRVKISPPDVTHVSWLAELSWLTWREAVDASRKNSQLFTQFSTYLVTSTILALAFMDVNLLSPAGVQGTRGLLYLMCSEVAFTHAYAVFNTFPGELPVFLRESHLYSSSSYYVAKVLSAVPRCFLEPLLFISLIQSQVDLTAGGGPATFLALFGILFLTALTASAYGCMLSAQFNSYATVHMVAQPIDFITVLVSGIYNTIRSLPAYVGWLRFASVFFYCHELLSIVYWRNVKHIDCPASADSPCIQSGEEVLQELGFDQSNLTRDLLCMALMCAVLHAVGLLGLLRRSRQQAAF